MLSIQVVNNLDKIPLIHHWYAAPGPIHIILSIIVIIPIVCRKKLFL